jgi:hypothetical protein
MTDPDDDRMNDERAALSGLLAGWSTFYPHMTEGARLRKAVAMARQAAFELLHLRVSEPYGPKSPPE